MRNRIVLAPKRAAGGYGPWERLAGTKCCSRECLLEISVEALKAQHEEWAAATTESRRLDVLASLLWDKPSARIAPYCSRRFYLAHGISRRRVEVVTAYLTTGSRPEHGLTRRSVDRQSGAPPPEHSSAANYA